MTISNYPGGFANGVTIRGVPITMTNPGEVFWVNSTTVLAKGGVGSSDSGKGTYQRPFATIDYAMSRCLASRGDIVMVMPGHTENITAAGGITMDIAGVAIIGLGSGSLRPKITIDTDVAATFLMSAASCTVHNLLFAAGFADIVRMIDVTAAEATIDMCEFVEDNVNENWTDVIGVSGTDGTADGLTVSNCRAFGVDTTNNGFMLIANDIARMTVENNFVVHDNANATAFITHTTGGIMLNCVIRNNDYMSLLTGVDALINNDVTTNTGVVYNNRVSHADTHAAVSVDADGMGMFSNRGTGLITQSGDVEDLPGTGILTVQKINGLTTSAAADALFDVTGGPVHILSIVGVVSTVIQNQTTTLKLQAAITDPSGDTDMSTAVDVDNDAVGTIYNFQGPTGILTPVTAGIDLLDIGHATLAPTQWIMTPGTIEALGGAASTGGVDWALSYVPLSPLSKIVAAS